MEVLSRSTRSNDQGRTAALFAHFGTPHYWIVDPLAHAITVWELRGGVFETLASTARPTGGVSAAPLTAVTIDLADVWA